MAPVRRLKIKGQERPKAPEPVKVEPEKPKIKTILKNNPLGLSQETRDRIIQEYVYHLNRERTERETRLWPRLGAVSPDAPPPPPEEQTTLDRNHLSRALQQLMEAESIRPRRPSRLLSREELAQPMPTEERGQEIPMVFGDAQVGGQGHIGIDPATEGSDSTVLHRFHGMDVVISEHVPQGQALVMSGKLHTNSEGYAELKRMLNDAVSAEALGGLSASIRNLGMSAAEAGRGFSDALRALTRTPKDR